MKNIKMQYSSKNMILMGLLLLCIPTQAFPDSSPVIQVKQGEVAFLKIVSSEIRPVLERKFLGKIIYFNRLQKSDQFGALIGVDIDEKAAEQKVTDLAQNDTQALIRIIPNQFERQELKVAPEYVNPSPQQIKRVKIEKDEIVSILSVITEKKLWDGKFIIPVDGTREGRFGSRRVFNGDVRNPHSGEDIAAAEKTPVYASNDGVIVGVVDHFFSGIGIIIDHGQGLFTEYFHLNKSLVKMGQKVKKGTLIGLVGHTGRATGPHLHWGMLINGARVNPYSVLQLEVQ